jgi:hypothetical protein
MRRIALALVVAVAAALVLALVAAVRTRAMPLGVPGEWEWLRVPYGPSPLDLALAAVGIGVYAAFVALIGRTLDEKISLRREVCAVSGLVAAAVAIMAVVQSGAPVGYGLAKWVMALHGKGSSGYFLAARDEAAHLSAFLRGYPEWVRHGDALHLGTHPPGLIAVESALLREMRQSPAVTAWVETYTPESVAAGFRIFLRPGESTPADRATIVVTGVLTLVCCAATVAPLYVLARSWLSPRDAWMAAALWPLVTSAVLFQPTADTAFPILSTTALALAARGSGGSRSGSVRTADPTGGLRPPRTRKAVAAAMCGVVLGVGMQFSLVFLAVGLIVAALVATHGERTWRERAALVLATGVGFLAVTLLVWTITRANPFEIWWWNQKNHARFYVEFPRSYRAWVVANAVELAVGLGLPATVWVVVGMGSGRGAPRVAVATAIVLALLTVSGKSLSEVGRLWLPFMPALLVAAGKGFEVVRGGPLSMAATLGLMGAQTLALQAMIQVVYPV